ncbi:MAG TPA: glycine cleavage T C-terminal barrel domain-containing protein [Thermoleophilaceae bacterium]
MIATTEYERLRETVGLVDRSERGKFRLTGAEVGEFLQGQVTNDVEALAPGGGCYATLLDHKGKIRADMRVLRGADWFWLDCEVLGHDALARTIKMYSLGRDVKSEDVTGQRAILSLIGPAAREALDATPPDGEHSFVEGEHGIYVATDLGVDVICAADQAVAIRDALGIEPVSAEAAECVRIESGRPRHGLDMGPETIPQEAGLNERAVNFEKGCYVGQETVARLHYKGKPNRFLRGLRLTEEVEPGAPIMLEERQLGIIGSTCVSPAHGPIALALVRREAAVGDTVQVGDGAITAEVIELPFEQR